MMFNTLGNLVADPRAGLLVVDFENGGTLQLTRRAEIVWTAPRSPRFRRGAVVELTIEEVVEMRPGLIRPGFAPFPYPSLLTFPVPCSLFPVPCSPFPVPRGPQHAVIYAAPASRSHHDRRGAQAGSEADHIRVRCMPLASIVPTSTSAAAFPAPGVGRRTFRDWSLPAR